MTVKDKVSSDPMDKIDWSGIRAAAVTIGIREAARQAAANLTPIEQERFVFRVLKRAQRESWLAKAQGTGQVVKISCERPLSANVLTGSESLTNALAEDSSATKSSLSKALRKGSKVVEDMPGEMVFIGSGAVKDLVGAASQLHGWEEKKEQSSDLHIQVLAQQASFFSG